MFLHEILGNDVFQVELLKRRYLQMEDPDQLPFPSKNILVKTNIQAAIYTSLFDCSKRKFSPPDRYKYRVLKKLLRLLEDSVEDPEEDVGTRSPL